MTTLPPKGQIAEQGRRMYEEKLAPVLKPKHTGQYLVLDVDSGDYEIDADRIVAHDRLAQRYPENVFYATRIGFGVLFTMAGRRQARS